MANRGLMHLEELSIEKQHYQCRATVVFILYYVNSNGPRIEPCGTPHQSSIMKSTDLNWSDAETQTVVTLFFHRLSASTTLSTTNCSRLFLKRRSWWKVTQYHGPGLCCVQWHKYWNVCTMSSDDCDVTGLQLLIFLDESVGHFYQPSVDYR